MPEPKPICKDCKLPTTQDELDWNEGRCALCDYAELLRQQDTGGKFDPD